MHMRAGEDAEIATPESVRRHIVHRMARLTPDARQMAKAASVLGYASTLGDAVRLADLGQDAGLVAAEELVRRECSCRL